MTRHDRLAAYLDTLPDADLLSHQEQAELRRSAAEATTPDAQEIHESLIVELRFYAVKRRLKEISEAN